MPRITVTDKVTSPDGSPLANSTVTIQAKHPSGEVVRWPAGDETLTGILAVNTDATGALSVQLVPSSELQPAGSYYEIHYEALGIVRRVQIPNTGPVALANLADV